MHRSSQTTYQQGAGKTCKVAVHCQHPSSAGAETRAVAGPKAASTQRQPTSTTQSYLPTTSTIQQHPPSSTTVTQPILPTTSPPLPQLGTTDPKSPLASHLQLAPWPSHYQAPPLPKYHRNIDPYKFLMCYKAAIASAGGDKATLIKSLIISLEDTAAN
jgi:hypothetical protein